MSKDKANKVDGRKTAWTPERRAAFSEYKRAQPKVGNRSTDWWKDNPQAVADAVARMQAGRERKRQERSGGGRGDRGDAS